MLISAQSRQYAQSDRLTGASSRCNARRIAGTVITGARPPLFCPAGIVPDGLGVAPG